MRQVIFTPDLEDGLPVPPEDTVRVIVADV